MNTPAPTPLAAPTSSTPPARTLSDEALDLATYKIADRVTERFLRRAPIWLAGITAVAALVGFVGLSAFKASVVRSVADNVNKELEPLTNRTRRDMLENEVEAQKIKLQNDEAQAKLANLNRALARIDELSARSDALNKQLTALQSLNDKLTTASNQAMQDIKSLRAAQLNLSAGRPSIVSWGVAAPTAGGTSTVQGTNFGNEPGTISIRVAYRHELTVDMSFLPPLAFTDWIPIDAHSVMKWSNTMINLKFSDAFMARYKVELAKLKLGQDNPDRAPPEVVNYRIQTKSGAFNEIQ